MSTTANPPRAWIKSRASSESLTSVLRPPCPPVYFMRCAGAFAVH